MYIYIKLRRKKLSGFAFFLLISDSKLNNC